MSTRPNYFKIGVFVVFAIVLIVVAVILFGAGLFSRNVIRLESYFAESITGLTPGSPVEFRGVPIGKVEHIGFVGSAYELSPAEASRYATYVRVVYAVPRADLPEFAGEQFEQALAQMVKHGLRVRVSSNILTSQAYLEANYVDPNRFPVEPVPWTPVYFRIPSAPGELTTIKDSIDSILNQLQTIDVKGLVDTMDRLFNSLDQVITDANVPALSRDARALLAETRRKVAALEMDKINAGAQQFLASLNQAVADANVAQLSGQARDLLDAADQKLAALDTREINAKIEQLVTSLDTAVADANVPGLSHKAQTLLTELRTTNKYLQGLLAPPEGMAVQPNVPEVVARLGQTIAQLNKLIASERPELHAIIAEFQRITQNLDDLVSALKEQPSSLLFSKPPRKSEVLK
jgi:phospholipid/cholesterol/gamma-HCH transport system substrate-binding protein